MKNHKKILFVVLALVLVGASVFGWQRFSASNDRGEGASNGIDYSPPTKDEQEVGDSIKDEVVKTQDQDEKPQNVSTNASVIITDAGQYDNIIEVRSFISNVYKDGTCTATFTKGSLRVTKTTAATRDATTTICANPLIQRTEFSATGTWQLIVSYQSSDSTASGQSTPKNVTIR